MRRGGIAALIMVGLFGGYLATRSSATVNAAGPGGTNTVLLGRGRAAAPAQSASAQINGQPVSPSQVTTNTLLADAGYIDVLVVRQDTDITETADAGYFSALNFGAGGLTGPSFSVSSGNMNVLQITTSGLVISSASQVLQLFAQIADGAGAQPVKAGPFSAYATSGTGHLFDFVNGFGGSTKAFVDVNGNVNAGIGTTGTYANAITTLKVDATVNGSGADTTEDDLTKFSIAANSLSANGKSLHATFWGDNNAGSTTDVETIRCYFGHATTLKSGTLLVSRVLTVSQANTWNVEVDIIRTGSATEVASATLAQGGTVTATVQTNSSPSGDTTGAMLVGCTGQRATSSVASSLRQLGLILTMEN